MRLLTKREKVLLYVMAVFAIVAGMVVLLIQPALEEADVLDASILERETSVDSITAELSSAAGVQNELASLEAQILEEQTYYLPLMTNNELDEYITGLLQTHGLTALALAISVPEDAPTDGIVKTYRIDTRVRGTMPQFMLLVDTVHELTGIRIAEIDATEQQQATPSPTPTPRNAKKSKTTPAPLFTSPTEAPEEKQYAIDVSFVVQEYDERAAEAAIEAMPAPDEPAPVPDSSTPEPVVGE